MLILRPYQSEAINKIKKRLKEASHPLLATVSVGGGKSILISTLLSWASSYGYRCLCLTLNSTLIKQNSDAHKLQGADYGINCAALDSKASEDLVIFASPNSICQDIKRKKEVSTKPFQFIIVDECHQISAHNPSSMYMRIFNHYSMICQEKQLRFRVLGFTGTPFRDKNISIWGEHAFFKEEVCNISTSYLIEQGYLINPQFGITHCDSFDFKSVKINNTGKFNQKELQTVIDNNIRLTGEIMLEIQQLECNGVFVFCSTIAHCYEALRSLPADKSAIIIGSTPSHERQAILAKAQTGEIKFLISVSILMVGVDVPLFDVCCWMRPTESLILYVQGIGRVLRLHPSKTRALVLDYSGNLDRHGHIDDPIINAALQPKEDNEQDYVIPCYTCNTNNTIHARRCIGIIDNKRCDHYFEFKECPNCEAQNDITSRNCRQCEHELIDPNAKLSRQKIQLHNLTVIKAKYWLSKSSKTANISYTCNDNIQVFESYVLKTEKARNVFYGRCMRQHVPNSSQWYPRISDIEQMEIMFRDIKLKTPHTIQCKMNDYGRFEVVKKLF